jgi:hypothetical protein
MIPAANKRTLRSRKIFMGFDLSLTCSSSRILRAPDPSKDVRVKSGNFPGLRRRSGAPHLPE